MHEIVRVQLKKQRSTYKTKHDKHKSQQNFKMKDLVWIYLQKE